MCIIKYGSTVYEMQVIKIKYVISINGGNGQENLQEMYCVLCRKCIMFELTVTEVMCSVCADKNAVWWNALHFCRDASWITGERWSDLGFEMNGWCSNRLRMLLTSWNHKFNIITGTSKKKIGNYSSLMDDGFRKCREKF